MKNKKEVHKPASKKTLKKIADALNEEISPKIVVSSPKEDEDKKEKKD
jgi:hypothetical protein